MKKPKLSEEEWIAITGKLHRAGWLTHAYNPKNGKKYWRPTKWGEAHYEKACKLVGADKLFAGNTLKDLKKLDLTFDDVSDQHLYSLDLITEVFDDKKFRETNELTRQGYEWFFAYTKLKGKKLKAFQSKNTIQASIEAILFAMFVLVYVIAKRLTEGGTRSSPKRGRKRS